MLMVINDDAGDIRNVGEDPVIVLFNEFNVSVCDAFSDFPLLYMVR